MQTEGSICINIVASKTYHVSVPSILPKVNSLWDKNIIPSNTPTAFFCLTKGNKRAPCSSLNLLNVVFLLSFQHFFVSFHRVSRLWFLSLSLSPTKEHNHTFFHNANTCGKGVREKSSNIIFLLCVLLLKQENHFLFSHISRHFTCFCILTITLSAHSSHSPVFCRHSLALWWSKKCCLTHI